MRGRAEGLRESSQARETPVERALWRERIPESPREGQLRGGPESCRTVLAGERGSLRAREKDSFEGDLRVVGRYWRRRLRRVPGCLL